MPSETIIKTTCARDCYDACGIAVHTRDGSITKVIGDPEHPVSHGKLCGKCAIAYNGAWRDPALRLSSPLRRAGPKSEGKFVAISWDEALAEVSERFRQLVAQDNAHTILHTHYTGTVGVVNIAFPLRFFHRLGATEVDPDTVCNKAGHAALDLTFGTSVVGFDPRTARDSRCILIWGANPSHSAPHQDQRFIAEAAAAGTTIIVVDPIEHATAAASDMFLKLRPGTDAALGFAFLNVMKTNGLIDWEFVDAHVLGAKSLMETIDRTTPAVAEKLCGVPADLIEKAARAYAEGPSLLWLGQGVQRQTYGGNVFRVLSALVAFSGNVGRPGAGFLYLNGPDRRGIDMDTVAMPELARGETPSISHMDLAATLEQPELAKALVTWNSNPAASSPEQRRLRKALMRDDLFHVAVELFHTDTTSYADIVLPAASFLECNDLVLSYFDLTLSAQAKAVDPPGDAVPNHEIFRRLAGAMRYEEPALFESEADLIERLLEQTPYAGSFTDLAAVGTVTLYDEPQIQFPDLSFPTESKRIQLANDAAVELGLPRAPTAHADERPQPGFLRIVSPASAWLMNSSYGNDSVIQKKLGAPSIILHPEDAAQYGVSDGDPIVLVNDIGRLTLTVTVSEIAQPGMGIVYKGRWPGTTDADANVNVLVSGRKSDLAENTTVHSTEVRHERV